MLLAEVPLQGTLEWLRKTKGAALGYVDSGLQPAGMERVRFSLFRLAKRVYLSAKIFRTISPPIASDAVAAGLGALSTCSAAGRWTKQKS